MDEVTEALKGSWPGPSALNAQARKPRVILGAVWLPMGQERSRGLEKPVTTGAGKTGAGARRKT